MKREEALHLANHHYRLHSSIKPGVDCSLPVSMYNSPKSTHYKPFRTRRPATSQTPVRKHGEDELNHFLSRKQREIAPFRFGFNAFARSNSALNLMAKKDEKITEVKSKLANSRVYQPPIPSEKPPKPPSQEYSANAAGYQKKMVLIEQKERSVRLNSDYYRFKDYVLDLIILRGVFTDNVIVECFTQEIAKRQDLDTEKMQSMMYDTLTELGVTLPVETDDVLLKKNVKKVQPNIRRSGSLLSLSSGRSSTPQSSFSSKKSYKENFHSDSSSNSLCSSQNTDFILPASPSN